MELTKDEFNAKKVHLLLNLGTAFLKRNHDDPNLKKISFIIVWFGSETCVIFQPQLQGFTEDCSFSDC